MIKKSIASIAIAVTAMAASPAVASASTLTTSFGDTLTNYKKGPEYRSKDIDGFLKCMAARSGYSAMGFGVSFTCHKNGDKWYFNYWRN